MTEKQVELLKSIQKNFNVETTVADLCLMYEITRFKDKSVEDDYWTDYNDLVKAGREDELIRDGKLSVTAKKSRAKEKASLTPSRRRSITFPAGEDDELFDELGDDIDSA